MAQIGCCKCHDLVTATAAAPYGAKNASDKPNGTASPPPGQIDMSGLTASNVNTGIGGSNTIGTMDTTADTRYFSATRTKKTQIARWGCSGGGVDCGPNITEYVVKQTWGWSKKDGRLETYTEDYTCDGVAGDSYSATLSSLGVWSESGTYNGGGSPLGGCTADTSCSNQVLSTAGGSFRSGYPSGSPNGGTWTAIVDHIIAICPTGAAGTGAQDVTVTSTYILSLSDSLTQAQAATNAQDLCNEVDFTNLSKSYKTPTAWNGSDPTNPECDGGVTTETTNTIDDFSWDSGSSDTSGYLKSLRVFWGRHSVNGWTKYVAQANDGVSDKVHIQVSMPRGGLCNPTGGLHGKEAAYKIFGDFDPTTCGDYGDHLRDMTGVAVRKGLTSRPTWCATHRECCNSLPYCDCFSGCSTTYEPNYTPPNKTGAYYWLDWTDIDYTWGSLHLSQFTCQNSCAIFSSGNATCRA